MLLAAGFAPAYQERKLSDPELAAVKQALDFMLAQQAPFPALVVDRLWNLQMANGPAVMLMRWLLGVPDGQALPLEGANMLKLMLDPAGLRPFIVNGAEVGSDLLQWIQREAMSDGPGSESTALLDELVALAGPEAGTPAPNLDTRSLPFLSVTIRKDDVTLNLFTSITTMGTPHDVTVHELRIEHFFPADAATEAWFRARASAAT
jgi:MmyB-like transcription regulator ligand binding domain